MERSVRIEHFRNVGFKSKLESNKDKSTKDYERLVLSHSLNKGELGDLIIIIGANNSGKSNVLDAINSLSKGKLSDDDKTDLSMDDELQNPKVTLFCRNDKDKSDLYSMSISYENGIQAKLPNNHQLHYKFQHSNKINIRNNLMEILETEYQNSRNRDNYTMQELVHKVNRNQITRFEDILFSAFEVFDQNKEHFDSIHHKTDRIKNTELYKEYITYNTENTPKILNDKFNQEFGFNFINKIVQYKDKSITSKDLETTYDSIHESKFFKHLLKSINVEISEFSNAYEKFKRKNVKGILKQFAKNLNEKINAVSEKFNLLYHLDNNQYRFEFDLESSKICFMIFRGEHALSLNQQSTGFNWFFNLFFNLLNSTELNTGDIIVMDEPATNLHVKGQRELRAFLKEFAIHNDISIVIATHSPFLIDMDYLDELRIVTNEENISTIRNSFTAVDLDVPDYLLPIRESLTVENHILLKPEETVVFVEGITDYNYLVAFKKLFGIEHISFLPINGVGKTEEESREISKQLIKIRKDAVLLVDSDKAGKLMKALNEESDLKVIPLSDISPSFKEIESLFSPDDLEQYNLDQKHYSKSIIFKNKIIHKDGTVSDQTKDNFKKVFDKLKEETE